MRETLCPWSWGLVQDATGSRLPYTWNIDRDQSGVARFCAIKNGKQGVACSLVTPFGDVAFWPIFCAMRDTLDAVLILQKIKEADGD